MASLPVLSLPFNVALLLRHTWPEVEPAEADEEPTIVPPLPMAAVLMDNGTNNIISFCLFRFHPLLYTCIWDSILKPTALLCIQHRKWRVCPQRALEK